MISIKKLATVGAAAGLLLASAMPVLADDDMKVKQENWAKVKNNIEAGADTGGNKIKAGDDVKGGKIKTGDATTFVDISNLVNKNKVKVSDCDCFDDLKVKQKNGAKVENNVGAWSDTGGNKIKAGDDVKGGKIKTGAALTGVGVTNVVNKNVVVVGP